MKREASADGAAEGECELLASDKRIHLTTEQGAQGTIPAELDAASARQKIRGGAGRHLEGIEHGQVAIKNCGQC